MSEKWPRFPLRLEFDVTELPSLLSTSYDSKLWEELGDRCLACGMCTNVCPTCYCFNVADEVDFTLSAGTRFRVWDSCQLDKFATRGRRSQLPRQPRRPPAASLLPQGQVPDRRVRPAGLRRLRPLRPGLPGRHHARSTPSTSSTAGGIAQRSAAGQGGGSMTTPLQAHPERALDLPADHGHASPTSGR